MAPDIIERLKTSA